MSEEQTLGLVKWAIVLITGVASINLIAGSFRLRAELDTRRECFASNERIAKTWAAAEATGYSRPDSLSHCDWR